MAKRKVKANTRKSKNQRRSEAHKRSSSQLQASESVQGPSPHLPPDQNQSGSLIKGLVILFFCAQTLAAGAYYVSDYPWDERFAWRMFSSVRNLKCQYRLWRGQDRGRPGERPCPDQSGPSCGPPLSARELQREHHIVWINLLKRGRLGVVDQLARHECARPENQDRFYLELQCPTPAPPNSGGIHTQDSKRSSMQLVQSPQVNLCQTPRLRHPSPNVDQSSSDTSTSHSSPKEL